jgi:hypothetical protein
LEYQSQNLKTKDKETIIKAGKMIHYCYVYVPSKISVLKSNPLCGGIYRWGLWWVTGSGKRNPDE